MLGTEKCPIPEDPVERFMVMVWALVEPFGIEDVQDVFHCVEMLGNSVDRYLFEKSHHASPQKKVHNDRKRFIAIFKARYLHLTDMEYTRAITPVDGKLINQINRKLIDFRFDCDDYLKWVFEVYLPENTKFCPPFIRTACSDMFVSKFLYEHKDVAKERKQEKLREMESTDLIARSRGLLRSNLQPDDSETLKVTLQKYRDRDITLDDFRAVIIDFENKTQANQAKENET
jgi:hypothetical protein